MPNDSLSSIMGALELFAEKMQPYKSALSILQQSDYYSNLLANPAIDKIGLIDSAVKQGILNGGIAKSMANILTIYHDISGAQKAVAVFGDTIATLVKPEVYTSLQSFEGGIKPLYLSADTMATTLKSITSPSQIIDTSWAKTANNWLVDKTSLASLDTSSLMGETSNFARLCRLEQETSMLQTIPQTLTSAASQIASIVEAAEHLLPTRQHELLPTSKLLDDYCILAAKQHKLIQKTTEDTEIEWRLGILGAASKFVDRQVTWSFELADNLSEEKVNIDIDSIGYESSALPLIPSHVGFTNRKNVEKTPIEGLQESSIVSLTEMGKAIVDNVLRLNKLQLDNGQDRIFSLSETSVSGMMNISSIVCTSEELLGRIIDGLYFVFYENLEHIKVLIGNGDKSYGDSLVRSDEIYQCIFDVKLIRSDLRHDLDHGKEKERKKKLKSVGDCYKKYCRNRPLKARDFRTLQEKLYKDVIQLEENLIHIILND